MPVQAFEGAEHLVCILLVEADSIIADRGYPICALALRRDVM